MTYPKDGWMIFMCEDPICGISPHPAYSPDADLAAKGDWFGAYHVRTKRAEALMEITEDWQAMNEARRENIDDYDEDDEDPMDILYRVRVHEAGRVEIFDENQSDPFISFEAHEIFGTFGVPLPNQG